MLLSNNKVDKIGRDCFESLPVLQSLILTNNKLARSVQALAP